MGNDKKVREAARDLALAMVYGDVKVQVAKLVATATRAGR